MLKSIEEDFSGTGTLACAPTIHLSEGLRVPQRSPRLCVIFCLPPSGPTTEQFAKLSLATAFQRARLQDYPHPFLKVRTPNLADCIRSATNSPRQDMTERWLRWLLNRN